MAAGHHPWPMEARIVGRARIGQGGREGERDTVVFAAEFPGRDEVVGAGVVAWVAPDAPPRLATGPPCFATEVDLRPYFGDGDPVEIDPYQGLVRHLREGYAFPVREVAPAG